MSAGSFHQPVSAITFTNTLSNTERGGQRLSPATPWTLFLQKYVKKKIMREIIYDPVLEFYPESHAFYVLNFKTESLYIESHNATKYQTFCWVGTM